MKLITAFIKPHRLDEVTLALRDVEGLSGASISDARGFGRRLAQDEPDGSANDMQDYFPCIRLEIACSDEIVEQLVSVIEVSAHTGLRGDGKIYIAPLDQAVRISTGERGDSGV